MIDDRRKKKTTKSTQKVIKQLTRVNKSHRTIIVQIERAKKKESKSVKTHQMTLKDISEQKKPEKFYSHIFLFVVCGLTRKRLCWLRDW